MEWDHDDVALNIAHIHGEIDAIRSEPGVAEILADAGISPKKTHATALMYAAYLAADSDNPDAAASTFVLGESEEGEEQHELVFYRVAVAVTHAIALSYARANRVEEAIMWGNRIYYVYGWPPPKATPEQRDALLALCAEGTPFEAVIDRFVRESQRKVRSLVVGVTEAPCSGEEEGATPELNGEEGTDDAPRQ